jgi:probable addiction module antidote protein
MTEKLAAYDPAEDLTTDIAITTFMTEALESGDVEYIEHALGVVARAKKLTQMASREEGATT